VRLIAPLTAITAAVVGVIANLVVFFAWQVFWPGATASSPFANPIDWPTVVIFAVCAVLLLRWRVDVIPLIAGAGLAGLALWALGLQGAL
jgi:chromate transporter